MTNPKPTEGWAIVAKDGRVKHVILGPHGSAGNYGSHDETTTPVTIIPTADLVREAARVLLGAEISTVQISPTTSFTPNGETKRGIDHYLRALAGQGGE